MFQEIRIEDKFKFEARQRDGGGEPGREINYYAGPDRADAMYWNAYAFALVLVSFVVLQLFVAFACWLCATRDKSRHDAVPAPSVYGPRSAAECDARCPWPDDDYYCKSF